MMRATTRYLRWISGALCAAAAAAVGVILTSGSTTATDHPGNRLAFANASGVQVTFTTAGSFDFDNPFFQALGTNGRSCVTCHRPAEAWTVTPGGLRRRFERTGGLDPIFRTNDGSTCEGADISTLSKRRSAFGMLLRKGVVRVGMTVPANAEFAIIDVDDPYHCGTPLTEASLFRRVLPSTNLKFLSTVMWDGRETAAGQSIHSDLMTQASHATTIHAQGATPSPGQLQQIADFELSLFTAQTHDWRAGSLTRGGVRGGPAALAGQPFCIGINDPLGMLPSMPGACPSASTGFDPNVFTAFRNWQDAGLAARRAIARGEQIFNTRRFTIDRVGGLNRGPQDPVSGPVTGGTCTLCHDTPNAGDHSVSMALDIGVAGADRRTPDLPLYTLQNLTTGDTVQTTDPGRAMVTGKWSDVGKFKGPILRALAARAPYFHNGSAATLEEVVDFYDTRFHMGLTPREKADLVAFLNAL
jgi:hypothetical protein